MSQATHVITVGAPEDSKFFAVYKAALHHCHLLFNSSLLFTFLLSASLIDLLNFGSMHLESKYIIYCDRLILTSHTETRIACIATTHARQTYYYL